MRFPTTVVAAVFVSFVAFVPGFSQTQSQPPSQSQPQTQAPAAASQPAPAAAQAQQPAASAPSQSQSPAPSQQTSVVKSQASAAPKQATPAPSAKPATVWTNDEVDSLRSGNSVSVVGRTQNVSASAPTKNAKAIPSEKDPAWYRKQLQPLQAEIDKLDAQIAKLEKFLSGEPVSDPPTAHRQMSPTPQEQLKQLNDKRAKDVQKVNDLLDQARHNDIPPGALR